jgi:hypothetical protein
LVCPGRAPLGLFAGVAVVAAVAVAVAAVGEGKVESEAVDAAEQEPVE